jgi:hypothetical protein
MIYFTQLVTLSGMEQGALASVHGSAVCKRNLLSESVKKLSSAFDKRLREQPGRQREGESE